MRGAWYAAGEIVTFMVLATILGIVVGALLGRATARRAGDAGEAPDETEALRAHVAELEHRLDVARRAIEELERERTEVDELRRTVARLEARADPSDELARLRRLLVAKERRIAELETGDPTRSAEAPFPEPAEALTMRTTAGLGTVALVTFGATDDPASGPIG